MMRKDYINLEAAILLNNTDFKINPDESHWIRDKNDKWYWISEIGAYDLSDKPQKYYERPSEWYPVVSIQEVTTWLRDIHLYHIYTTYSDKKYIWHIISIFGEKEMGTYVADIWEDAMNDAIIYTLKNLL